MATTIQDLEERVDALYNSVLQLQRNLNPVIDKSDNTANAVEQLTPTTYTKTAYIGDTSVIFDNVVSGNLTIYTDNMIEYTVAKNNGLITISFEPLEYVTTITLSIL